MKNLLLSGIALLFGSTGGAWAGEYWVPGNPLGAVVEYVLLDFSPKVHKNTGGLANSRIELGLAGDSLVYSLDYNDYGQEADQALAIYQSLLHARAESIPINVLADEDTRSILAVRFGSTEHPLALDGAKVRMGWGLRDAGKVRFDLLGRNASVPFRPSADPKLPARLTLTR